MADEATTKTPVEGEQNSNPGEKTTEDQKVPYSRFEEVNKRAKDAEQRLAELNERLLEFEDRDKSEVERERAARTRAETQLTDLMGKVTALEKGAWVRSAAAELNFHDPEDAMSHLRDKLAGLEDERDAKRLVQSLAKTKKHLVREEKQQERPSLSQVFSGQGVNQQTPSGQQKTPQQMAAERELRFAEGLRDQLGQFRDGWHHAGGIT